LSSKPRETANVGAGLWKATGMWAWLLFRISGVILAFYLVAHIIIISMGQVGADGETFNSLMKMFDSPLAVVLDLCLVAAVLYHALNGVRIVLMDFGIGIKQHKVIFYICMAVAVVCLVFFAYVAFDYLMNGNGGES
jgi:succinate dehydrogenase / fumarate reductase cytochrome b subunit